MAKIPIRDVVSVITDPMWQDARHHLKEVWPRKNPETYTGIAILMPEYVSQDNEVIHGAAVVTAARSWEHGETADFFTGTDDDGSGGMAHVITIEEVYSQRFRPSRRGLRQSVIVNSAGQIIAECYHTVGRWADA